MALDAWHELRCIRGVWWHVRFAAIPADREARARCFDVVLEQPLTSRWFEGYLPPLRAVYGTLDRYAIAKREPGKRELARLRDWLSARNAGGAGAP
jgi:hypothetical protein